MSSDVASHLLACAQHALPGIAGLAAAGLGGGDAPPSPAWALGVT